MNLSDPTIIIAAATPITVANIVLVLSNLKFNFKLIFLDSFSPIKDDRNANAVTCAAEIAISAVVEPNREIISCFIISVAIETWYTAKKIPAISPMLVNTRLIFISLFFIASTSIILFDTINPIVSCLLYTSDAADEEDSVDLGGRRI